MDSVTSQLRGVLLYIDNVLVASPTEQQHERDLVQIFSALKRFGLVLNVNKCEFRVRELEFLGHHHHFTARYSVSERKGECGAAF